MDYMITEEETVTGIKTIITFLKFVPSSSTLCDLRKFLGVKGEIFSNGLVLEGRIKERKEEQIIEMCQYFEEINREKEDAEDDYHIYLTTNVGKNY